MQNVTTPMDVNGLTFHTLANSATRPLWNGLYPDGSGLAIPPVPLLAVGFFAVTERVRS